MANADYLAANFLLVEEFAHVIGALSSAVSAIHLTVRGRIGCQLQVVQDSGIKARTHLLRGRHARTEDGFNHALYEEKNN